MRSNLEGGICEGWCLETAKLAFCTKYMCQFSNLSIHVPTLHLSLQTACTRLCCTLVSCYEFFKDLMLQCAHQLVKYGTNFTYEGTSKEKNPPLPVGKFVSFNYFNHSVPSMEAGSLVTREHDRNCSSLKLHSGPKGQSCSQTATFNSYIFKQNYS